MYNRREFLQVVGAGAAGALAGRMLTIPGQASAARPPGLPPNIIVLMSDDQGYFDTSIHGSKFIPMPNLESLVAGGVQFTNGYTSGAVCSPTRAGFHTGRYQQRFDMNTNSPGATALQQSQQKLIASYLRPAGYASKLIGKWHLGTTNHPMDNYGPTGATVPGYDEFFGFLSAWVNQTTWPGNYFWVDRDPIAIGNRAAVEAALGYSLGEDADFFCDAETRVAEEFITRKKDQPFFLYMAYGTPHTTIATTQKWLDRVPATFDTDSVSPDSDKRNYAGMLMSLDDSIGRIVKCLRDNNIEQDTIIFYLSDNGGAAALNPQGVQYSYDNFPFEGHKADPTDGGYHVPFAIRWPGHITPGVKTTPVISLDMGATALGVAGVSALPSQPQDGLNLMPWLTGQQGSLAQRYLFWNHNGSVARDWTKYKMLGTNVYNLETDIEEKTPLAANYVDPNTGETRAAILARLQNAYNSWNASL